MNNRLTNYLRVILILSLVCSFTELSFAQTNIVEKDLCLTTSGTGYPVPAAKLIAYIDANGNIVAKLTVDKRLNDNTYGANTIGWPGNNHTLDHLLKSDKANFVFYNKNGTKVLDFFLDYMTATNTYPSGYGILGVTGGDGSISVGSASSILNSNSSLNRNFNQYGYVLTTNSPATNSSYTPNPSYPNWIFEMVYEVTIDKAAFGGTAGFGDVFVPSLHNSPNKLGLPNQNDFVDCTPAKASIGDKVWEDLDKDGIQDVGELGIANVTVKLYTCTGTLVATTTTNSSGIYSFTNLTPGDYYVVFNAPTGYTITTKDASGSTDVNDSDADATTGKTICTTLIAGENDLTWDAGIYLECKNKIGDFVWHDSNANGVQDTGEKGIAGVVVELIQGSSTSTKTTDVNGYYEFTNLSNGTYGVRVAASNYSTGGALFNTQQTKWYSSPKDRGSDDSKDSDANKNETVTVSLSCGDNVTVDFGYYKTCVNITKTTSKQSYNNGETITYSFLVENCGDIQLHGGIDIFDAMLNKTGNHLIKHIDILDPRQSTTFTMNYLTSDQDCGQLVNTVRAEGHPIDNPVGGQSHDTVVDESIWTVSVICQDKADVKIEKSVDNPNPQCDDYVTFTIKATNLGPNTANGIQVTDLLPSGLNYVSNTASQGSYNSTTGIWTIGTLANNTFATLTIRVKVDCGQVNNSAFDLGVAKDYNLFVIEDANQPSSDTQGKAAVGRNATFANYSIGDLLPANSGDVLIVGNSLNFISGAIYGGNVVYGYSSNLPQSNVSITGGTLRKDSPINFASAKVYLENLSTTLSTSTVNGTTTFQYGGLTLTGSDPFLNVFTVTGANLSSANNVSINVPNGSVVLVNIGGTTLTWTGGLVVNGTAINNVLFNFYQATSITVQGIDIRGSVLAPFAAVNFASGVINGQMICKSLTGMGQFNLALFGGQIPLNKKITNTAVISGSSIVDPNPSNNSSSATVTINGTTTGGNTGGTWTNVSSFGQGEIVYTLAYSGSSIYAGTWGGRIYKSTDAGKNWVRINTNMNVSFIWSLNISGGIIFAATEQGVYKYNGSTWELTSLSGKDVHSIASYNGTIYAATWGFGIFKSTNGGTTWTEINNGLGGFLAVQSLTITSNGNVFAGTAGGGIFKCTDGQNWTKISCGHSVIWSLASTSNAIFSGTYGDGLYRSLDGGMSFTKTSLDITFVYSISVDLTGKIYVSSLTNGVYVSSDNGTTWSSLGMGGFGVSAMMVNPNSSDVYVGTKEGKVFMISGNNSTTDVEDNSTLPNEYKLAQNYPNPFNPSTTIQFVVPEAGMYSLKVYNVLGEEVANLINNQLASGLHKVNFDASRLASGMYIYKLSGNNVNISKKMILMK